MTPDLWAVIPAAGASTRLGQPKQLLKWRGKTLLQRAVGLAGIIAMENLLVVLGHQADLIRETIQWPGVVINPDWENGMGSSLALGVSRTPVQSAVLVLLCDQPGIEADDLLRLHHAWRSSPDQAAAAAYHGTLGVPAIFPTTWRADLRRLSGDRGARALLRERPDVLPVPMPNAAADIDSTDDWSRFSAG